MISNYDSWLLPRERCGIFEVECQNEDCGHIFESPGDSNEALGVELRQGTCPGCGGDDLEVIGEAEPPEPDYDRMRDERDGF